jgi:hypothetical protein
MLGSERGESKESCILARKRSPLSPITLFYRVVAACSVEAVDKMSWFGNIYVGAK